MHKNIKLFTTLGIVFASGLAIAFSSQAKALMATPPEGIFYDVDFFNNYLREEFELSNGTKARGNNIIYQSVEVLEGNKVDKPEDPIRKNYEFQGWFKEQACENEWDFEVNTVENNLRLYAKWGYSTEQAEQEPEYTPPSTVLEESASTDYVINSIMNFKVENEQVLLPTAAMTKLAANATDVLPLMEYKVKASKTITATYNVDTKRIGITCGNETRSILARDNSAAWTVGNTNYETKAKKYEAKALEEDSYHVMLAGSSSIEFWESSKQDLSPVVSYNHGIGGTTIEEWTNQLNQRLVYPYKPKMVVYYVGINNVINSKQDASTIWNNLKTFFDKTHADLPDTKVQYIMMNLIPGYKGYFDVINTVNAQVVEYQKTNAWLTLINPGTALLKENGEPNAAYFRTDGLHLSYYGYVIWGGIIRESIFKGLEN